MANKVFVYSFQTDEVKDRMLLGGKGANLAIMTGIGLRVPPGFTITTEACNAYLAGAGEFPAGMEKQLRERLSELEQEAGKVFGDAENPLLVSVRSGGAVSMPGMMDTILNLGLNDLTVQGLAKATEDARFAFDCYRRFIQMFANVVLGVEQYEFEGLLTRLKEARGADFDHQLSANDLEELVEDFKELVVKRTGQPFPEQPYEQLLLAVRAVFASWNNHRAIIYRKLHDIPDHLGTAVNVQTMVFGNMGEDSGTGVAFTRNPSTGEKKIYGEYLINAQGEDVVAGIRTPNPIATLAQDMPEVYAEFVEVCRLLEAHYHDMQDIEFTVEKNRLYILQTRAGKRTTAAAVRIAVELVEEGVLSKEEALMRVEPQQLDQLLHRHIDPDATFDVLAQGLPASPGAASGRVVFTADEAVLKSEQGEQVLLVRTETTPDDLHGMVAAEGILTSRGGMTSHAAVVARGMGKPCVSGCEALRIDYAQEQFSVNGRLFKKGDLISIDGTTGRVIAGTIQMIEPELSADFNTLLSWADAVGGLGVRTNADTPADAQKARDFGAQGIGLVRTEHMFMAADRLPYAQQMILAENNAERRQALDALMEMQEGDFYDILKVMEGFPVCIRLLDPPLHEFLPRAEDLLVDITTLRFSGDNPAELAAKEALLSKVRSLSEFNPMLGHRGCRLGVTFPEIYETQASAIFKAMARLNKEGYQVHVEVEVPLVGSIKELQLVKENVTKVAVQVQSEQGLVLDYTVGTMIELPRACLIADQISAESGFFTFGTNDLTQTTYGYSRDDAEGKFLPPYLQAGILLENPFEVIDREGVGELMRIAVERGRQAKPHISIGICGEHGGNPSSIEFCHQIGLDYVSCSPYRVPIARLAAAQAAIKAR